jgi:hypothetical protein
MLEYDCEDLIPDESLIWHKDGSELVFPLDKWHFLVLNKEFGSRK